MNGESAGKVEYELESVTLSESDWYKFDKLRHEVDSKDEVMHSEMSDW